MTPDRARELLGLLPDECSEAAVHAAFARAVRAAHPDTGCGSVTTVNELQQARDVLMSNHDSISACQLCHGVGMVRGSMGWRQCGACGDKNEPARSGRTFARQRRTVR